jgi:ElaB/YqjD/DUF883 family membrane-anchored ribosome-binding protein
MPDENEMNQGPAIPPEAEKEVRRSAMSARKAAEHLHSAADATVADYRARGKEVWEDALHRVRSFQDDSKQYVRENPTKAVFTALGIGLMLGLMFRR